MAGDEPPGLCPDRGTRYPFKEGGDAKERPARQGRADGGRFFGKL